MRLACRFIALALLAAPVMAEEARPTVKLVKLADNLYELTAVAEYPIGSKLLALTGPDGALLVDTAQANTAAVVRQALEGIGAARPRLVVNTHHHDDHMGGNAALAADATVIASDAVRRRLATGLGMLAAHPPGTLPTLTFDHTLTLHLDGEEVRLAHRPDAHTDGDVTAYFVRAGVVAVGDLAFPDKFPYIPTAAGGTLAGYLATLQSLADGYPEGTRFVAAHGPHYTAAQLRAYRAELVTMRDRVASGQAAGKTPEQLQAENVLAAWPSWGDSFVTADRFLNTLVGAARPVAVRSRPSVLDRLAPVLVTGHGDDAVALYRSLKAEQPDAFTFDEAEVNQLGYVLLAQNRTDDAIAVLRLNAAEHPQSGNAFDSLGEAYAAAGHRELAIEAYSRSLELDPGNQNAVQVLARLRGR